MTTALKIQELTNEELLVIYYRFKRYLDKLEQNFKDRRIAEPIETPIGPGVTFREIDSDYIDAFKTSPNYMLAVSLVEKLKPVVDIIEDVPEMKTLAEELR
jgi:hypothetical protein